MQPDKSQPSEEENGSFLYRMVSKTSIFLLNGLSRLSMPALYVFSDFLYFVLYRIMGYRKKVVRENLLLAFPQKSDQERLVIERNYFKHLSRLIVEIFKMRSISREELLERMACKNHEAVQEIIDQGKSVMLCSAHYGNWEWVAMAISVRMNNPVYTIYKPLNNKIFERWLQQIRQRFGNTMIPMRKTLRTMKENENEHNVVCVANDQAPPKKESHYWLNFMNQPSSFDLGVEKIARKMKRPIFYTYITSKGNGYYEMEYVPLSLDPENSPVGEITNSYAKHLADTLEVAPATWLWSHRRWKHKPEPGQEVIDL